jgi:hypothetical protein
MPLTPWDLWKHPREAAEFISSAPSFSYLPPLNPPSPLLLPSPHQLGPEALSLLVMRGQGAALRQGAETLCDELGLANNNNNNNNGPVDNKVMA